jgi:hypothetical protein
MALATVRRFARRRWRTFRAVGKAVLASPPTVRTVGILSSILLLWLDINWTYHAFNKPTEVLFPLDHSFNKNPTETWKQYGSLFRKHATSVMTPELLAALAQVEGGGNPVARQPRRARQTRTRQRDEIPACQTGSRELGTVVCETVCSQSTIRLAVTTTFSPRPATESSFYERYRLIAS